MPRHAISRLLPLSSLLLTATMAAQAPTPPLLAPVAAVPVAAQTWEAAERLANPTILRTQFVAVDTAALLRIPTVGPAPLGTLALDLFGRATTFDVEQVEWTLGYRVFTGSLRGIDGEVHLTLAADGTTAALIALPRATYAIASSGVPGVHVLEQLDPDRLPAARACGTDHTHAVVAPTAPPIASLGTNSDCGLTTIDIIVFYTPQARLDGGGQSAIEATIVSAIAQANTGHDLSGAPVQFRLVHMAETTYTELGTGTDLASLRDPADGFMDEVHAARDTYGADLVHLITSPSSAAYCGIGYLMGSLSTGFESSAFAVTVRTCISNRSLTHECGHNMGCHHDAANAGPAIYPYSYGYRTPDNAFRTIMAYAPGTRVNRWSGPGVVYQGYTMGTAGSADNVLTLVNTCLTVSQFRATIAPRWCDLGGGIAGASGVPTMTGAGTINLADPLTLTMRGYVPGAIGLLVVGTTAVNVPLFGGTLVPAPEILLSLLGSTTEIVQDCSALATLAPGTEVWAQSVFLDASAPEGLTASDGVKVTVP